MTKFSNKLKKPCFLAHFRPILPILGAKKIFLQNPALSRTTSHGILAPCENLEKLMTQFQENARTDGRKDGRMDGRMDGRTDGQTLFYRTLQVPQGVQ